MVSTGTQRRETSFRCLNISDRAWEPQATETLGWLCNLVHPKEHPHACCHTGLFLHRGVKGGEMSVLFFGPTPALAALATLEWCGTSKETRLP